MSDIHLRIANLAKNSGVSDFHITDNMPLRYRANGLLQKDSLNTPPSFVHSLMSGVISEDELEAFEINGDTDFAIDIEDLRFRVNAFKTASGHCAILRLIPSRPPSLVDLNLPPVVSEVCGLRNGLVLVTGATGSGKSTSLAAMIRHINETKQHNIITIEDPIEFIHEPQQSNIVQRQVGKDTTSFARSLRGALRQDPDVILVGELRDLETIGLALTAAETGHLVFATLHTSSAPGAITRMLDVFPVEQQAQIKTQLAQSLRMVLTQSLHRTTDGTGRVASFEVLINNTPVSNLIREGKVHQLLNVMQTGRNLGMVTMEHSVAELKKAGLIPGDAVVGH
ncbi:type IV pilus twitching motility protein PilT [Roseobacter sp. HKCCD7870]|uniref:type IV pilus twitching motility protein PilT n=1 Tax=Roseobacter sp. HKCCD7870 TaxID=3120343 RepID=UPI0030EBE21A